MICIINIVAALHPHRSRTLTDSGLPLTDMAIRIAKPKEKLYKMFDGDGLYLLVAPLPRPPCMRVRTKRFP